MEIDSAQLDQLLLKIEAEVHRHGWDQPARLYVLYNTDDPESTSRFAFRHWRPQRVRVRNYAAALCVPPDSLNPRPNHRIYRMALNLKYAAGSDPVDGFLSYMRTPGFLGVAFVAEGWYRPTMTADEVEEYQRGNFSLADRPGAKESRTVHAEDVTGHTHWTFRSRGEPAKLMDLEGLDPSGSVFLSLKTIAAAIAGQPLPELFGEEPRNWDWNEQVFGEWAPS